MPNKAPATLSRWFAHHHAGKPPAHAHGCPARRRKVRLPCFMLRRSALVLPPTQRV